MFRNRFLIVLGGCFLAASAAWADDVGYVDCSSHSEGMQVFAKPRKTPDVVASVACGERFTVLVYGFVFSQIQTRDGKVGFIYSNVIAVDHNVTSVQQAVALQVASARTKVSSSAPAAVVTPKPPAPAQPQPVAAEAISTKAADPAPNVPQQVADAAQPTSPVSVPSPSASAPSAVTSAAVPPTNYPDPSATVAQPDPASPAQPQPTATQPSAPQPAVVATPAPAPAPASNTAEPPAAAPQPDPAASARPEPASPEPAAAPIRPAETPSWEKPLSAVRKPPLIELYGGYAFSRMGGSGGAASSNLNGVMGSFGWNARSWLQIMGDSTYNFVTVAGTKNVLYGNHYGPRFFYRSRNRWGLTPFAEALIGGSRADTTVSGASGYTTSTNCISYKAGGGFDIHPTRHWEIRVIDVDYYRTAFGTGLHQTNYWVSTGVVFHLFGGSE